MTDPARLVTRFHATYGLPVRRGRPTADLERVHLRMALIAEEFAELVGAVYGQAAEAEVSAAFERARGVDAGTRDVVETADALGDLVYVIYGMALECGIPLGRVLEEVQASNMSKLGADGEVLLREDGKVLKGPNYFRPRIDRVLAEAGTEERVGLGSGAGALDPHPGRAGVARDPAGEDDDEEPALGRERA